MLQTIPRPTARRETLADYVLLATCRVELVQEPLAGFTDRTETAQPSEQDVPDGRLDASGSPSATKRRRRAPYMYTSRLAGRR